MQILFTLSLDAQNYNASKNLTVEVKDQILHLEKLKQGFNILFMPGNGRNTVGDPIGDRRE